MEEKTPAKIKLNESALKSDIFVKFPTSIMVKCVDYVKMLDTQINILVGISSAILIFSVSQFLKTPILIFLILTLFSALSCIAALYAIHPPRFMRKCNQKESLMYHGRILRRENAETYTKELIERMNTPEKVVEQYAREIYNTYQYYYRPKRRLFKWSRNLLMFGVIASLITFVLLENI